MNNMKLVKETDNSDIYRVKTTKKDIIDITLVENAKIRHLGADKEYINGSFLVITNRKGDTRVLDLMSNIDITNMLGELEIIYDKATKKTIFQEC